MSTPQERQRVADVLRDQPTFDMDTDFDECLGCLCDAVTGGTDGRLDPELWSLQADLADLIDPTCRVEHYCDDMVECESCGAVFSEWMDGGKKPVYCPMCGSRIEWEDE